MTDKQAKDFFAPLLDVLRICGPKVVIRFLQEKKIVIKAITETRNLIQFIHYKDSINDLFQVSSDHRLGIYDLSEFVNLAKIFESGVQVRYNHSERRIELVSSDNEEHSLYYYICDETVVPKAPESIDYSKLSWATTFNWNQDKFETLSNAMKSLKYPNLIINGKKDETSVTVSITESDIKTTTFKSKVPVDTPLTSNLNVTVEKANIINILTSSVKDYEVNICDRLIRLKGSTSVCDVEYILTPLKK